MAKSTVTIHTTDGHKQVVEIKPGDEKFYDDLPFTSTNVLITEVTPGR